MSTIAGAPKVGGPRSVQRQTAILLAIGIASLLADRWSEWFYHSMIVPRLPSVTRVPLAWWMGEFAPMLFVVGAAGTLARSLPQVQLYAFATFSPPVIVGLVRNLGSGGPFGHDIEVSDSWFWIGRALLFLLCLWGVALAHAAARVVRYEAARENSL